MWVGVGGTGLWPQQRIALSNLLPSEYIHTRDACVYVLQPHLSYSYSMSLTAYHHAFKFLSLTSTFIVSVPVPRLRDSCTGMSVLLSDRFPCSFFFFSAYRLRQISSALFSSSSLCVICTRLLCCMPKDARTLSVSLSLTECAFPHLSKHLQLNLSSEQ